MSNAASSLSRDPSPYDNSEWENIVARGDGTPVAPHRANVGLL
jgi:hypothetical protein